MRLREFVANSLPRVRGKKKKQLQPDPRVLNNEGYAPNKNRSKNSKSFWGVSRSISGGGGGTNNNINYVPESTCEYALNQAVKTVCGEIINTFNIEASSYRANNPGPDSPYTCYNDLSAYQRPEVTDKNNDTANISSDSDKQFNSYPKSRSRIRTNPWLPSPRSTPSNSSGSSSPTSSISTFPLSPVNSQFRSLCIKDNCVLSTTSSDSLMDTDNSAPSPDVTERRPLGPEQLTGRPRTVSHGGPGQRPRNITWYTSDSSANSSPCNDTCNCNIDVGEVEHNISFEYEEVLDDRLEKGSVTRDHSLQDLLDDHCLRDVAVQTDFEDYDIDSDWILDGSSDDECTDLASPECSRFYGTGDAMLDSIDTGYSSLGRDGQTELDDEFEFMKPDQYTPCEQFDSREDKVSPVLTSITESGYECGSSTRDTGLECDSHTQVTECERVSTTQPEVESSLQENTNFGRGSYVINKFPEETSGRTLQEIKSSLEEKVFLLRQEKRIVEQKILEAQEEAKIRKQEKIRFHRQLSIHRKHILLKTLHDLKSKLESQSDRLQDSYSAILTMQKKLAHRSTPFVVWTRPSTWSAPSTNHMV